MSPRTLAPAKVVAVFALLLGAAAQLEAATLSGVVFEDRNADGIQDAGEPPLEGVPVYLFGTSDSAGTVDEATATDATGFYSFTIDDGCYLVQVDGGTDRRVGPARTDCPGATPEPFPVGERRTGSLQSLVDDARAGSLHHYALGDSIAAGVSVCFLNDTNYHDHVHNERTRCVLPSATLDLAAVGGHTTEHLLRDPGAAGDTNTILDAVAAQPDLVSISIGGNDFLDVDPGPTEPGGPDDFNALQACAARAFVSMRANAQEGVSTLMAALPDADVEINTVYDNLADDCSSTVFHNQWVPIGNELLRNLAWGQIRPAGVAEVWPDYAHQDVQGTQCCGFENMICTFDLIHPNEDGRDVHENRFWESLGGVLLGPRDDAGSNVVEANYGLLQRVDTRRPTATRDLTTDGAADAGQALDGANDLGAAVPVTGGAFHVEGFDAEPRGVEIDRAVVGIRYRGVGTYVDDLYWFEASFDPDFPLPGETIDTWNTIIPLVGGSEVAWSLDTGNPWSCVERSRPGGTRILLDPEAREWRSVSAMLTTNLVDTDPASGRYTWPKVTFADLANLSVRLRSRPVGAPDAFAIEWDDAWVDLYGVQSSASLQVLTDAWPPAPLSQRADCRQALLDPATDVCSACVMQSATTWIWAGGGAGGGETLRVYEIPGAGCIPVGDADALCVSRQTGTDLRLELTPGGCN